MSEIQSGDVHVWRATTASEQFSHCHHLLSDAEAERAKRFLTAQNRDTYVLAHAMLRSLIGRYLGTGEARIDLAYSIYRKPFLPDSKLAFNLTHSADGVLIAIGWDRAIGIDLEAIQTLSDQEELIKVVMSGTERAMLSALDNPERGAAFYQLWTRKEALLKATGAGLRHDMSSLTLDAPLEDADEKLNVMDALASTWTLVDLQLGSRWRGALAAEGKITALRHFSFAW
ncbi:4'-phosphopantetheinyl transferase superfamily protein [Herbaspirillum sp. RTI4]|uniref:4'-phosphopantetheinyl transferase family protein n=1 Tax=Herbaspirillum sp. RTI4 TaxID=3048640 RepID=UPI002AB435AC|nr:4'-phosphopantetheinyl transferase superfamily protein [Herbaspirillum sp. RTI4]MDY7578954.1 4'-phosphopantetheinyl transferase superfamily protein [Herbaspirillum sp. RTI4]MEA9980885.1 4'-phosphopantetheinyl transferase superfamily protein [Herbaspirillum sp. RTI4]